MNRSTKTFALLAGVLGTVAGVAAPGCGSPSSPPAASPSAPAPGAEPAATSDADGAAAAPVASAIADENARRAEQALVARHGEAERERIRRGVAQVRALWRPADGDAQAFEAFVEAEFLPQGPQLEATFARFEFAFERIGGFFVSMSRDLRRGVDLELGPMLPLDLRLAAFSPGAHMVEDLFASKIAFVALLNFPLTTLDQRLAEGMQWSREQWAEARLTDRFRVRVPAEVAQRFGQARTTADSYINDYNIYMHHLVDDAGQRPFPAGLRLISHWGLRDELKARYADADGVAKQRMIQRVMERIVRQEIPAAVVNNPLLDWNPASNEVRVSQVADIAEAEIPATASAEPDTTREPDTRYQHWLSVFAAARLADPYHPDAPTHIDRRFDLGREIPEAQVQALLEAVLRAPESAEVAKRVAARLGRPLEPFDIWYVGFKPRGKYTEADLDKRTRRRYPSAQAYAKDMPRMLRDLGFSRERAQFLADHIVVEPSRGAGHALGAARRDDAAHLRTRIGKNGMDYKGYNIAVHEMGHNVEQVFSVTSIDYTLIQGVPNTAFTEALAFVFQNRDLELLGLGSRDAEAAKLETLNTFWATREIAGVGLVDMKAWRWLYEHPDATPADFREAVVGIAQDVWNEFYADIFGVRDVPILAVYSHMIDGAMYTPDYPMGHLIAFQIETHFEDFQGSFGGEFERICKLGQLTPDAWMRKAVGAPLSAEPLIEATRAALSALR
ncbi:hypothetical protein [Haliangium ochraceum]|uniref:M3 family oligoendopeptidase n=1 Tax=Haliangium ochraceum (strain DSM 14365 / JCM 11303 / SMP-2) TaxID=502025 RepID=D0LRJ6_HALO1|nr:hypothetical protein [Haliangium ochraceum]ACY17224.1 conserved hypothetical protein [Haliangium ochraceum DSM 14365]